MNSCAASVLSPMLQTLNSSSVVVCAQKVVLVLDATDHITDS